MDAIEKMKVYSKLDITDKELERFRDLKNNFFISDILFNRDSKNYKVVIEYDVNYLGHLFGKEIEKEELFYTLKCGNKIIIKSGRKNDIKKWLRYNLK